MKKYLIFLISLSVVLFTLSCAISYEGLQISDDPDPDERAAEELLQQFQEAAKTEQPDQEPDVSSAEEKPQSVTENQVTTPDEQLQQNGENEYSVSATDFGCVCTVDNSTMSVELKIEGDQLEYAGNVYNKISENTFERSYMGYYILVSGEGDNKTSTQVEEERRDVIILTEDGFISEHYQGEESSPCCFHTFTLNK
jgi:hypothetical protein